MELFANVALVGYEVGSILVEGENLDPVPETDVVKPELWQDKELVALLAVRIGTTRLIDNEVLL